MKQLLFGALGVAAAGLLAANDDGGVTSNDGIYAGPTGVFSVGTTVDGAPALFEEMIGGKLLFLDFAALPKAEMGESGRIEHVACTSKPKPICLLHLQSNNRHRTVLATKTNNEWHVHALQFDVEQRDNIAHRQSFSFGGAGNVFLAARLSSDQRWRIIWWNGLEPSSQIGLPVKAGQLPVLAPVIDSANVVTLARLQTVELSRQPDDPRPADWTISTRDRKIVRLVPGPSCIPQAVIQDKIICIGEVAASAEPTAPTAMLSKVGGFDVVTLSRSGRNFDIAASFFDQTDPVHYAGGSAIFDVFEGGVLRPYRLDLETLRIAPLLDAQCAMRAGTAVHISARGVTDGGNGVLFQTFGPLVSQRTTILSAAAISAGQCPESGRLVRADPPLGDTTGLTVTRERTAKRSVPFTLVTSTAKGVASGRLMVFVYGADGIWLNERFGPAWNAAWLAKGGAIAFVHLRGGGGYGARWWHAGSGVAGKSAAIDDLVDFGRDMSRRKALAGRGLSIYAGSAGGIVASMAAIKRPDLFPVVALRAPCFWLQTAPRAACTLRDDFGNPDNAGDRKAMMAISPLDAAKTAKRLPHFAFLIPQTDDRIPRGDLMKAANTLPANARTIFELPGVNHTDLLPPAGEKQLIESVASIVIAKTPR